MVLILSPLRVHAEEAAGTVNEATGREAGPAGNRQVAVMVYGESITEIATRYNYTFRDFQAALKSELQGVLANEKLPDVEMYLVNDQNQEYKLTKDAVPDAAFLSSFKYRAYGLIGYSEYIFDWIQGIWQWLVSGNETYGNSTKSTARRMCRKVIIRLKSERLMVMDIFLISPAAEA